MKILKYISVVTFLIMPAESWAQACCSAGTPLLSSLELPATPKGSWQFALTYEYNTLKDVYSGTDKFDDDTRNRLTHSGLFEISYGLTNKFSISALVTFAQQERKIEAPGVLKGDPAETFPVVETTWETWKELYPNSKVVTTNTGFSKPYGVYPYGDYKTNGRLIFPVSNEDSRLSRKERVLGVVFDNEAKIYQFSSFGTEIQTINDNFKAIPIVVTGSTDKNFMVAYERMLSDGTVLTFSAVPNELPVVMIDNEGTKWNIFGEAVAGPRTGKKLKSTTSFIAYWFAWATFYPGLEIH